MFNHNLVRVTE